MDARKEPPDAWVIIAKKMKAVKVLALL